MLTRKLFRNFQQGERKFFCWPKCFVTNQCKFACRRSTPSQLRRGIRNHRRCCYTSSRNRPCYGGIRLRPDSPGLRSWCGRQNGFMTLLGLWQIRYLDVPTSTPSTCFSRTKGNNRNKTFTSWTDSMVVIRITFFTNMNSEGGNQLKDKNSKSNKKIRLMQSNDLRKANQAGLV